MNESVEICSVWGEIINVVFLISCAFSDSQISSTVSHVCRRWVIIIFLFSAEPLSHILYFSYIRYLFESMLMYICSVYVCFSNKCILLNAVPGPCDPEDLIDGIIFAATYMGCTHLLSERTPTKSARMQQAQEAMSRVRVRARFILCSHHSERIWTGKKMWLSLCNYSLCNRYLLLRPI